MVIDTCQSVKFLMLTRLILIIHDSFAACNDIVIAETKRSIFLLFINDMVKSIHTIKVNYLK